MNPVNPHVQSGEIQFSSCHNRGANPPPPPHSWEEVVHLMNATVRESEQQLLNEVHTNQASMRVQAFDFPRFTGDRSTYAHIARLVTQMFGSDTEIQTIILTQIENLGVVMHTLQKCENTIDYYNLLVIACRFYTGQAFTVFLAKRIDEILAPTEVQASADDALKILRSLFDTTTAVTECPLAKKLCSLYSYLLTQGFLRAFGMSITDAEYTSFETKALRSGFSSKKALIMSALDTALFVCERIQDYRRTGEISSFMHSGDAYAKWYEESARLQALAPFLGNLEAHKTSMFEYIGDLNTCIEQGQCYTKMVRSGGAGDSNAIARRLQELQMLKNNLITRKAAQQERAAPMGVLIYGESSVGKSTFTKMLYNYYGGLFGLSRDDQYRYVRNPMDEYWSNFDTSKWCIQLDDIAFLNPAKTSEVDGTLQDLLNVVNNVPYVPPQAALEDKGKTPILAELVLATSNTEHLHAHEYFSCPLAVRRRLPYVVNIVPKPEFMHSNCTFLDPSKVTVAPGQFPDFWKITVSKIEPLQAAHGTNLRPGAASLVKVAEFTDVNAFLQHFGAACKTHKANQASALTNDVDMSHIDVCRDCGLPLPHDVCSPLPVQFRAMIQTRWCVDVWDWFWYQIFRASWVLWVAQLCARYRATRWFALQIAVRVLPPNTQIIMLGNLFAGAPGQRTQRLLMAMGIVSMMIATYYLAKAGIKEQIRMGGGKRKVKVVDKDGNPTGVEYDVQGNALMTTQADLPKSDVGNVWHRNQVELTAWDMPSSVCNDSADGVRDRFGRNTVLLRIKPHGSDTIRWMRGVFVSGHSMITNAHAFEQQFDRYTVSVIQAPMDYGVGPNIEFELESTEIVYHETLDLCAVRVASIPLFKDITGYWATKQLPITSAVELIRQKDGTVRLFEIYALDFMNMVISALSSVQPIFHGLALETTEDGMCGSLAISITPRGPVIVGLHLLGRDKHAGFMRVLLSDIKGLLADPRISRTPVVNKPERAPGLGLQGRDVTLGMVHRKSVFSYLKEGVINVYGALPGHRAMPKSSVCETPFHKAMLEKFDVVNDYGKPVMNGWAPWRLNVVEMVKPKATYKRDVLRKCIDAYVDDVTKGLTAKHGEAWKGELVTLDNQAAVNGLPGVKYIDRINTSTSMGFPWGCTKKKFLESDITIDYPEGVDFSPESEVWQRVAKMEETYARGERAYPVFTAHLKDEATSLRKVEMAKTRVFAGAPVDFSLVVRKNLLSFVRLVQNNQIIFEASPGLVTQSEEWGELYDHLTKFGPENMVAGDYKWFDKNMLADFMLAAFEIIYKVWLAAGYSPEEALIIMCIGEDTSFPLTNFNGDLVEFFGTNPSGHPLTVILNSLVNCLYMRYCYHELNPKGEVKSFKSNAALTTYGDDNVAGVNPAARWFNHTAIVEVLATLGVGYTMPDKEAESVPFVHIDDISFLKRRWIYDEDVGAWLAPLEEESIIKSLTMWVPSKTVDKYHQMVSVIESANNEYFFHGREKHSEMNAFFTAILAEEPYCAYVKESTLLNFDQLIARFRRSSA